MLVRYPGLSAVGGLGIAVVIACGTATAVFDAVVHSTLPFEDGDRVVAIENWDTRWNNQEHRAVRDFVSWRDGLRSVVDVGAYRLVGRNLTVAGQPAEPVRVAEISAAAFRVARVPPIAGRHLMPEDERGDAPPVVVIGYDEWQRRFAGDPGVIGRSLQLGETTCTVVGVMPRGFGFPVNERVWIPLRLDPSVHARRQGPVIFVFGRLADGIDLATAQAEIAALGDRAAAAFPDTHARLRPRVVPYTQSFFDDMEGWEMSALQVIVALLLVVVCANVAVLVYARTAARRVEFAVRTALGASRSRIVGQMFVEGLALAAAAAALGLLIAAVTLRQVDALIERIGGAPFWMHVSLQSGRVAWYVVALTLLGAGIIGVVPALQVTGRRARVGLQHAATNLSGWRLGRTHAALIVAQVAVAVAILPAAIATSWTSVRYGLAEPGFPAHEFLTARLVMDRDAPASAATEAYDLAFGNRFRDRQAELVRRLQSEPAVASATFLIDVPGREPRARVEVDSPSAAPAAPGQAGPISEAGIGHVGADFFDAFDVPVLAGRIFDARDVVSSGPTPLRDLDGDGVVDSGRPGSAPGEEGGRGRAPERRTVVVNRTFAERMLGGLAVGRRVRMAGSRDASPGPWLEVVGVVADVPAASMAPGAAAATLYHPASRDDGYFALLAVHVRGRDPAAFAARLREVAATIDRTVQVRDVRPLDVVLRDQQTELRLVAWSTGIVTLSVLLLSAAGLYALMAFTVAQRRREIGIRIALGANPHRILGSIFSRALIQLAAGIAVGVGVAALLGTATEGELTGGAGLGMLPVVASFMLLVGVGAAVGPARRGLRIQPTEALRAE
jgi:predicted permease